MIAILIFLFSNVSFAQQSFFNVPSSERTKLEKNFFQEQMNISNLGQFTSNTTYDFGSFENFEIGGNVLGLSQKSIENGGQSTDLMANAQYFFDFIPHVQLSLGAQAGLSLGAQKEFAYYAFLNLRKEWEESGIAFVVGLFNANSAYLESGSGFWHTGLEIPISRKKLHLVFEYINGDAPLSNGVWGLMYFITPTTVLSGGVQTPSLQSQNEFGGVLELTFTEF